MVKKNVISMCPQVHSPPPSLLSMRQWGSALPEGEFLHSPQVASGYWALLEAGKRLQGGLECGGGGTGGRVHTGQLSTLNGFSGRGRISPSAQLSLDRSAVVPAPVWGPLLWGLKTPLLPFVSAVVNLCQTSLSLLWLPALLSPL